MGPCLDEAPCGDSGFPDAGPSGAAGRAATFTDSLVLPREIPCTCFRLIQPARFLGCSPGELIDRPSADILPDHLCLLRLAH